MSSKIFNALLEEKIDSLINSFKNTSRTVFFDDEKKRLIHSGEFGTYREKIVKDFLKFFTPQKFEMGTGFIISPNDDVSTQCDIIVYDRNITPLIQSNELQTFYPAETAIGVGEVKSIMSKDDFKTAINKLARIKQIKSKIPSPSLFKKRERPFNPQEILWDSTFTFIVCEKLDFNFNDIETKIDSMYDDDIEPWHRHNLILSIEDGLLLYNLQQGEEKIIFYGPTFNKNVNTHRLVKYDPENKYFHFKTFAMSYFNGISQGTILFPDMVHYLDGFDAVTKLV